MKRKLHCEWPLAYAEVTYSSIYAVSLKEHLVSTAHLIDELFSERLDYLEEKYRSAKNCIGSIKEIAYLAGLLHDLGKASVYYLDRSIKEAAKGINRGKPREKYLEVKLGFKYHEYVAPILIVHTLHNDLSSQAKDPGEVRKMKNIYYTLSRIIARHHAAMTGRHPTELLGSRKKAKMLVNVLKGLCDERSKAVDLLHELKMECRSEFCKEFLEKISNNLQIACTKQLQAILNLSGLHLKATTTFELNKCGEINEYDSYRIVSTLAGYLIVADNLVATYCERRTSDDRLTPAYVKIWERELKSKLIGLKDEYLAVSCCWP